MLPLALTYIGKLIILLEMNVILLSHVSVDSDFTMLHQASNKASEAHALYLDSVCVQTLSRCYKHIS